MKNYWNKLLFILGNVLNIKPPPISRENYDRIYTDDFRDTDRWALTHPAAVTTSRANGATLSLRQLNNKSFVSPCIISKSTIYGGCVVIKAQLSESERVMHVLVLRHKKDEFGFKIAGGKIYAVAPYHTPSFKLYKPELAHTFEIDVHPENDMIYWRVDGRTVYELRYPSHDAKHLMISMPTVRGKINPKELPIACNIHSVDFFDNNYQHLTRTNEE